MYNKNGLVRDWGLRAYRYTVAAVYTVFLLVASRYYGCIHNSARAGGW